MQGYTRLCAVLGVAHFNGDEAAAGNALQVLEVFPAPLPLQAQWMVIEY